MAVVVFNDRFSPNVGDGLLAACLERELGRLLVGETVTTIDVDGKPGFPASECEAVSAGSRRRRLMRLLPGVLKNKLSSVYVSRRLRQAIGSYREPRAFVIGGGHLINGAGTYFPLRIRELARIARRQQVPLFVQSVGVTDPAAWNPAAARWLRDAFDANPGLRFVSVRDSLSARYWAQAFPNSPAPEVCPDPGLLTCKTFGEEPRRRGQAARIGIGVMARAVARRLASEPGAIRAGHGFYLELCRSMVRRGAKPCLFTNGDPEDQVELEALFESIQADDQLRAAVCKCDRPANEQELVATIAQFRAIVAHRMHATIAAHSLGIPAVGLAWDRKLESFFRLAKRERYFIAAADVAPEFIAQRVEEASRHGVPEEERRAIVRKAEEGVRMLAGHLGRAAEARA